MPHRLLNRLFPIALTVTLTVGVPILTPAWACGCGTYSPGGGGTAAIPAERALVVWAASGKEDVYLSLEVSSTVTSGALLFPVPNRTVTVDAGPKNLFSDLDAITAISEQTAKSDTSGFVAGTSAPQVSVLQRQAIGPLDVAILASRDPAALSRWLHDNGFSEKPGLATAARPYTDQGWAFAAVRLRPGAVINGTLDPLHLHFAVKTPIYPMRLSAMARAPERVRLFTLAAGEMRLTRSTPGMHETWSGPIPSLSHHPDLARVVPATATRLARFDGRLYPAEITDDFHFRATSTSDGTGTDRSPALWAGGLLAALTVLLVGLVRRRRRQGVSQTARAESPRL